MGSSGMPLSNIKHDLPERLTKCNNSIHHVTKRCDPDHPDTKKCLPGCTDMQGLLLVKSLGEILPKSPKLAVTTVTAYPMYNAVVEKVLRRRRGRGGAIWSPVCDVH